MDVPPRDQSTLNAKSAEIQSAATEIAVEFRQLLSFVESRNGNKNFDYAQVKVDFEGVATNLIMRLDNMQVLVQGMDLGLREKCQQLSRLLRSVIEDVRNELIASSTVSDGATPPPTSALAARLPRSTTEAVGVIKAILAAAQALLSAPTRSLSGTSPPRTLPSIPSPSVSPSITPTPNQVAQPSPLRTSNRPLTISRTNSSPHNFREHLPLQQQSSLSAPSTPVAPSTPLSIQTNIQTVATPAPPSPLSSLSPTNISIPSVPSPASHDTATSPRNRATHTSQIIHESGHALQRSTSLPHHPLPPQSLNFNTNATSPRRSISIPAKRSPRVEVTLLADGTTSHPRTTTPTSMVLLVDKRKDPGLTKLVRSVLDSISWIVDVQLKAKMLAYFVGSAMGKVPGGDFDLCSNCAKLREKYVSDPCPLGEIKHGYARHRALLYKYLADSMSLPARIHTYSSTLRHPDSTMMGERASSPNIPNEFEKISVVEIFLESEKKWCVVDLVKDVGELYEEESTQAKEYRSTGFEWEDEQPPNAAPEEPRTERRPSSSAERRPSSSESSRPTRQLSSERSASEDNNNFDGKLNGGNDGDNTPPSYPVPKPPTGNVLKARNRSGTGAAVPNSSISNRAHRHSSHSNLVGALGGGATIGAGAQGGGNNPPAGQRPIAKSAQVPQPYTPNVVGRVLRFPTENAEIILNERIGKGTFGDVYRCKLSGYTCAVKIVNIKSLSEAALKMLHNEIYFLETLQHENIIGFLGHEEIPKREIKIFMEFMPLSLSTIIQKRNSSASFFHRKDLFKCAKGMAEALAYLHHRKIIHRDIKSSNVLLEIDQTLDRIQEVRLCDFGVSKLTDTANAITFTGTNLWVAPEVFDVQFGIATQYDEKCDIWSFGMVLVEMVTLNPPYHGISTQQATQSIRSGSPPPLDVNPNIDPSISSLIYACLKKVPSERPSATEILNLLNQM